MELTKNLLRKEKRSYYSFFVGILFFVISFLWIIVKIREGQKITIFDWVYSGLFSLNGIVQSLGSFGFQIEELFGKAFIIINDERISIKTEVFDKEQTILWADIKKISYNINKFQIIKMDGKTLTLDVSKINYALKNEVRELVENISNEKHIINN